MKLRTLFTLALGVAVGYKLARTVSRDDPSIVKGPRGEKAPAGLSLGINGTTQRLADQMTGKSLDVIRSARQAIHARLTQDPDATWN